jgi:co-chaperonin GroES (HSP10)
MSKKKVKFHLQPKKILFSLNSITAGVLATDSKPSAENHGTILQVGSDVQDFKKGDQIICAMWGVEHFKVEDTDYYVIDHDHRALLASYEAD